MSNKTASVCERITHAIGYEIGAIAMFAPLMTWIFNKPLEDTGTLAVIMSMIAMLWNMTYNTVVDRIFKKPRIRWSLIERSLHGLGFEGGLITFCLPLAAWMLDISLFQALLIELGFFVFILPYTVIYNWIFDTIKHRIIRRRTAQQAITNHP